MDSRARAWKRAVLTAAVVAALAGGLLTALAGSAASTTAPALVPTSIAFWDNEHGLIGTGLWCSAARCPGAISATSDGGRTSRVLLRTSEPVSWLSVAPGGWAWAVIGRCDLTTCPAHARLLRSSDWGATWRTADAADLTQVSFTDATHGLGIRLIGAGAPGARLQLVATLDGGTSWHPVTAPCPGPEGPLLQGVSLVTSTRGWALCVAMAGAGSAGKSIYRTDDGGGHWKLLANAQYNTSAQASGGISVYGYPQGIAFASDGLGVLWESRGTLYLTRDGGRHWKPFPKVSKSEVDWDWSAAAVPGRAFALLARPFNYGAHLTRLPASVHLIATRNNLTSWQTLRRWTYRVH